jgi:hypothetical protein
MISRHIGATSTRKLWRPISSLALRFPYLPYIRRDKPRSMAVSWMCETDRFRLLPSAFQNGGGPISQSLTNLAVGNGYEISFQYALLNAGQSDGCEITYSTGWFGDAYLYVPYT